MTGAALIEQFENEVGRDLSELWRPPDVYGWINAGIGRLPARYPRSAAISWAVNAGAVTLPTDLVQLERLTLSSGYFVPYQLWGTQLRFFDPNPSAGAGTVFYYSRFPSVTEDAESGLPSVAEEAGVFYAAYRFFRKLSSSRADYRRYSTISGQSGLDVEELDSVAQRYLQDYLDARDEFERTDHSAPATFYGE